MIGVSPGRARALRRSLLALGVVLLVMQSAAVRAGTPPVPERSGITAPSVGGLLEDSTKPWKSDNVRRAGSDLIENGEVHIRRLDLRGKVFYPQYGITPQVISDWVEGSFASQDPWLSVAEMHRLADSLTGLYQDKGLTFAQVYVVPQEIVEGRLELNVLVGVLAEVDVYDNDLYSKEQLLAPFRGLVGKELYEPDVVQAIESLNRRPGLRVFGIFSMGNLYGESRLNLRIQEEDRQDTLVRVDNFGVDETGRYRLMVQHVRNNLFGDGGALQATVVQTSESGNLFGGLSYYHPLGLRHSVTASFASSQYEVGGDFAELGLTGVLEAATLAWGYNLERTPEQSLAIGLSGAAKRSRVESDEFQSLLEQQVQYATLVPSFEFSRLHQAYRLHQSGAARLLLGAVTSGGEVLEKSAFGALELDYRVQYAWPFASLEKLLVVDFRALYSPDPLPSAERRSLTGAQAVRGYEAGLFSADKGYQLSASQVLASWNHDSGWSARPFLFIDHGFGQLNDARGNWARFTAAGLGIEADWRKSVKAGLTWGQPLEQATGRDLDLEAGAARLYGHLSYRF